MQLAVTSRAKYYKKSQDRTIQYKINTTLEKLIDCRCVRSSKSLLEEDTHVVALSLKDLQGEAGGGRGREGRDLDQGRVALVEGREDAAAEVDVRVVRLQTRHCF